LNLSHNPNIKLVGFDRYYNIDISSHKLPASEFDFYDVSDLSRMDIQNIYDSIPLSIRKTPMISKKNSNEIASIFEIVNYNINKLALRKRYKNILLELNDSDPILLDLLLVSCYLHSCRVPSSFEVTHSYL